MKILSNISDKEFFTFNSKQNNYMLLFLIQKHSHKMLILHKQFQEQEEMRFNNIHL